MVINKDNVDKVEAIIDNIKQKREESIIQLTKLEFWVILARNGITEENLKGYRISKTNYNGIRRYGNHPMVIYDILLKNGEELQDEIPRRISNVLTNKKKEL